MVNFTIAHERRGLPTVTPDAGMMVSAVDGAEGLILATGCQVAGVAYSPGIGRVAADLVMGQDCPLTAGDEFAADRFGDLYTSDARLRDHCETTYGTMYWGR